MGKFWNQITLMFKGEKFLNHVKLNRFTYISCAKKWPILFNMAMFIFYVNLLQNCRKKKLNYINLYGTANSFRRGFLLIKKHV